MNLRRRIWIDPIQTRLALRLTLLCLSFFVSGWLILNVVRAIGESMGALAEESSFGRLGLPVFVVVLSILGLIGYDCIRFVHRLVGPMYRFRKTVQAISAGEPVPLVRLRQGDFFQEFAEDLNEMLTALERQGAVVIKQSQAPQPAENPVCQAP